MEWICTADMPWMWRIHMTFSSSLIMPTNIEILDSICGGKNRNFTFFAFVAHLPRNQNHSCRCAVLRSLDKKDYNGSCLFKGENGSLLYLICTKNIQKIVKFRNTFESPFSLGFSACPENSWDCYPCAYIGAISLQAKPLHIAQTTPWNRSSRECPSIRWPKALN